MAGQTITAQELDGLVNFTHPNAVSLCVPTSQVVENPRANSLAFKNLANQALSLLDTLNVTDPTPDTLKQLSDRLLDDKVFWTEQANCLVVLVAGDQSKLYKLDENFPELAMVNDHYYVLPFISQYTQQSTFYLLELDKENTQMWRGTSTTLEKVTVPDLPTSLEEVTGTEMNERSLQFHTSTDAPRGGIRAASYHGSSLWKDDLQRYEEKFLQAIDKAVVAFFKSITSDQVPLLLSGVEEATVMFRQLSDYPHIVEPTLTKVVDPTHKEKELHAQAWEFVSKVIASNKLKLIATYHEMAPNRKTSVVPEVLRQIAQGKVGTLLVAADSQLWGMFDSETMTIMLEDKQKPGSAELLNLAARLTLMRSGEVVTLPSASMPDQSPLAAVLRY